MFKIKSHRIWYYCLMIMLLIFTQAVNSGDIQDKNKSEWVDLFADGTFSQWKLQKESEKVVGWEIKDGVVQLNIPKSGSIITHKQYKDFELTFEWKISPSGNSGVKYRYNINTKKGLEYQVLDDKLHKDGQKPTHRAASIYDILEAPDDKPINPVGEWNQGRIVAKGSQIEHWLNGKKVASIDQSSKDWEERFGKSKYKKDKVFGLGIGAIQLQDHGDKVWYRNVRIYDKTSPDIKPIDIKPKSKNKKKKDQTSGSAAAGKVVLQGDIYEAEDAEEENGCAKRGKHTGFQGNGYMDFGGEGSYIEWKNVNADEEGLYLLSIRYAGKDRPCELTVNGEKIGVLSLKSSISWTGWEVETVEVKLKKGANSVRITSIENGPNLDALGVQKKK